ncbi:MAG: isochorismatase [Anaerolineae bacterium]|nr:MAG: isochorismatase [Anaerolineae bacterium]
MTPTLPIPPHYSSDRVESVWRVPYEERSAQALEWRRRHQIEQAAASSPRVALFLVDVQNTFCIPDFELFVGGHSGRGAVEDNQRLCGFIYQNLAGISQITMTLDTHQAYQIFFASFLIGKDGSHPTPYTLVTRNDIREGRWRFNPDIAATLGLTPEQGQKHLEYYVAELSNSGRYDLTVWPYHGMLGGIGHALVSAVEEAVFFHSIARTSPPDHIIKGFHPLTEHYSTLGPEVARDTEGRLFAPRDRKLIALVQHYDAVIITGQAKSHCVAFTIRDLLSELNTIDPGLAKKIFLLEDCTSPVVVPGTIDYTEAADEAFESFRAAGMHLVKSTDPMETWLRV